MTKKDATATVEEKHVRLGGLKVQGSLGESTAAFITPLSSSSDENPWSPDEIDSMEMNKVDTYKKLVEACRFFYKKDALSSTTLNKLVEIGITELLVTQNGLSDNAFRAFQGMLPKLKEFAESMAMEYLLSGLVIPEVEFAPATKEQLKLYNIKKYDTFTLPTMMWLRDPTTVTINTSMLGPDPSYYVEVPDDLVYFINNDGTYKDGTKDLALFSKLKANYGEFVLQVKKGVQKVLLDNKLIIRRKTQSYQAYPIPYLEPALEALKHKRNLRRMDYSLASRVISAILLFRLGSDEFPVTEEDDTVFEDLKNQVLYRDSTGKNVERMFQLFANHTLNIDWIMPDVSALVDDKKYSDINQEIIFALGFPRILITGESERTGTSDPQFAMMAPIKTMEDFRSKILGVLQFIITETARLNRLTDSPDVSFRPINLNAFADFMDAIKDLYASGNVSRTTYADLLGIKWEDEINMKEKENALLSEKGLEANAPLPFSNAPTSPTTSTEPTSNTNKPTDKTPKTTQK